MKRLYSLVILLVGSLISCNSYSLSITCKPPKIIKESFNKGELQWHHHRSKNEGDIEGGLVIDGILPVIRNGAIFSRLLVYIGGKSGKISFELATEVQKNNSVGFTFEVSKHLQNPLTFRAFYYPQDVCPKTVYLIETRYSIAEA